MTNSNPARPGDPPGWLHTFRYNRREFRGVCVDAMTPLYSDRCRCMACGEYFNSPAAFDRHRVETLDAHRRCVPPAELGMTRNATGHWIINKMKCRAGVPRGPRQGHVAADFGGSLWSGDPLQSFTPGVTWAVDHDHQRLPDLQVELQPC